MTRINTIDPKMLHTKHLVAEYRELPRIFGLVEYAIQKKLDYKKNMPKDYVLGKGHVTFFYDKLDYLAKRHEKLVQEMIERGYKPNYTGSLKELWKDKIPERMWNDYTPTSHAIEINQERINQRLTSMKGK